MSKGEGVGSDSGGSEAGRERGGQVVVVAVVVGVETSPNGRPSYTSTKCWGALKPTACAVAGRTCTSRSAIDSPLAKLVEHSEVEQAACTT